MNQFLTSTSLAQAAENAAAQERLLSSRKGVNKVARKDKKHTAPPEAYPCFRYNEKKGARIFNSQEEYEAAGSGWVDTPAAFNEIAPAPDKDTTTDDDAPETAPHDDDDVECDDGGEGEGVETANEEIVRLRETAKAAGVKFTHNMKRDNLIKKIAGSEK